MNNGGYLQQIAICTDFPFDQALDFQKFKTAQNSVTNKEGSKHIKKADSLDMSYSQDGLKEQALKMVNGEQ